MSFSATVAPCDAITAEKKDQRRKKNPKHSNSKATPGVPVDEQCFKN